MKHSSFIFCSLSLSMVAALCSCAHKEDMKTSAVPQEHEAAASNAETQPVAQEHYIVKKGDSLWKIAGRSSVLGDSLRWPLLFRQNRDQIEDPDIISIRQDLSFNKNVDAQLVAEAVKEAEETPPYVPHSEPRKSLAIKYSK
jgi:hypothetical protein